MGVLGLRSASPEDLLCSGSFPVFDRASAFEGETEFFDNRIGENFSSHALNFRFRFRPGKSAVQCELEIFALTDFLQALIAHFLESTLDGFSLRIQNALLQRNIHVSFHGEFVNYTSPRKRGAEHARTRPFGQAARPNLPARSAGFRDGAGSGRLRVAGARAGGTALSPACGVGWQLGQESAGALPG